MMISTVSPSNVGAVDTCAEGNLNMSLSEAMLADVLLGYLRENEEFERRVLEKAEIAKDYAYITLKGGPNKRLLLRFVQEAQGGGIVSEKVFAIKIETID
jgi:hypothetical protein